MAPARAESKPLVAVAGASGFVGTHLRMALKEDFDFRALTRSSNVVEKNARDSATEWCQCDLYSLPKVTDALRGCRYGIYLVHSMAPSSRLVQGDFEDTDLLLADNFVRAAEEAGLDHLVYLSGLMPENTTDLSPHLRSRLEVETVLRSRSVKVSVLRAGLIFGPGGSSFSMLVNLVRRLPLMVLPAWTKSVTHSIDIDNVCEAFRLALTEPTLAGGTYDLGGHEPMRYAELIERTAELLDTPHYNLHLPANCFTLSKHWVALFSGLPLALVSPLQESLRHDLQAAPNPLLERLRSSLVPFESSFRKSVDEAGRPRPNPRSATQKSDRREIRKERRVRSVQRMPLPLGWNAHQVAREYGEWLSRVFGRLIAAEYTKEGVVRFLGFGRIKLLELTPTPYTLSNTRRCAFYISSGLLARKVDPQGRFEFRLFPESRCMIASIHGFAPTLPWWIYARTQAVIHLRVMKAFAKYLERRNQGLAEPPNE